MYQNHIFLSFESKPNFAKGYVFMDVIDKTIKTYKGEKKLASQNPVVKSAKNGVDCLVWQTFASGTFSHTSFIL
jgi:hypothetical protein